MPLRLMRKQYLKKTEKEIKKCFKDDELLYDPEGMESALMQNLNKLKV